MDVLPTELWLCDDDVVSLMRSAEPTSLWIHETDLNDPVAWIQLRWYTGQETLLPVCKLLDILNINQVGCIIDQSPHFYPVYLPPIDYYNSLNPWPRKLQIQVKIMLLSQRDLSRSLS